MELNDAKRFLNQASYFDLRIKTKVEELEKLKELEKVQSEKFKVQRAEALQEEIRMDIDSLVAQKQEIMQMIGQLSKPEYQTVLELRYLRGWTIKRIAMNMHFTIYYVYELHTNALKEFSSIIKSS